MSNISRISLFNPRLEPVQVNMFGFNAITTAVDLVQNGDFTNTAGWVTDQNSGALIDISAGEAQIDIDPIFPPPGFFYGVGLYQDLQQPLQKGVKYTFSYTIRNYSSGNVRLGFSKQADARAKIYNYPGVGNLESWVGATFFDHVLSTQDGQHVFDFIPDDHYDRLTFEFNGGNLILLEGVTKVTLDDLCIKPAFEETFERAQTLEVSATRNNRASFQRAARKPKIIKNLKIICDTYEQLKQEISYTEIDDGKTETVTIDPLLYHSVRYIQNVVEIPFLKENPELSYVLDGDHYFSATLLPLNPLKLVFETS